MKTKTLLSSFFMLSALSASAAVLEVTSNAIDPLVVGTLPYCISNAVSGDEIQINFDGTEINLGADILFDISGKTLTIDGMNKANNKKLLLTNAGSKRFFDVKADATLNLKNLIMTKGGGAVTNAGTLNATDCEFIENSTVVNGGAINGGGIMKLTRCVFDGNKTTTTSSTGGGGAIQFGTSSPVGQLTIESCSFINNTSTKRAGAVYLQSGATITATNSLFANNYAGDRCGAIGVAGSSTAVGTLNLINCTVTGNQSIAGAGGIGFFSSGSVTTRGYLINTVVAYNVDGTTQSYNDIREFSAADVVYAWNSIYGIGTSAFEAREKPGTVKLAATDEANLFYATEPNPVNVERKRPVIQVVNGLPIAMIAQTGSLVGAGTATLPATAPTGLVIPAMDKLGAFRGTTPSIGSVEYANISTGTKPAVGDKNAVRVYVNAGQLHLDGFEGTATVSVYSLDGRILRSAKVIQGGTLSLAGLGDGLVMVHTTLNKQTVITKVIMQ